MGKFAPVYMSVYDGPDFALVDLTLDSSNFTESSAEDTAIGTFQEIAGDGVGDTNDSTLTLVDNNSDAVKLDGFDLVVGPTASVGAGTFNITVRETNIYGNNNPHDTVVEITVDGA